MNASDARSLLKLAETERTRLRRHLLVAAALRAVLSRDPVVVGGTAEEYWTADEYHQTDLDICAYLSRADRRALEELGFKHGGGRHWERRLGPHWVAVEFPDSKIDGDEDRTVEVTVQGGKARIIGLDDLYLDRLRQATMSPDENVEFKSALAVAGARYDEIDWKYVESRIRTVSEREPLVGDAMRRINSRIRRRVRQRLSSEA